MATHEAQSYKDNGTPEEQSRRTFMTNATLAVGGIITLVLAVPLAGSLIPESLIDPSKSSQGVWADATAADMKSIDAATNAPVKFEISFQYQDGYLPPSQDTEPVWGVKLSPQMMQRFRESRPDLYTPGGKVPFDAYSKLGFAIFSSICPHLGCSFEWNAGASKFICPCHGSQFDLTGAHTAGPALRGLDPLPFRETDGKAQVTWIRYKTQQADRVIVSYN